MGRAWRIEYEGALILLDKDSDWNIFNLFNSRQIQGSNPNE